MQCLKCKQESGSLVLCRLCSKGLKKSSALFKRATIKWHDLVVGDSYNCYHPDCKESFTRDMLCGDHIKTKGSHGELRFDINNGRPTCAFHNDSNNRL